MAKSRVEAFFSKNFKKYHPSRVHRTYRETFAYRLSELVFGSLIASYILGFLAFASSMARETSPQGVSFYFDPFAPILPINSVFIMKIYILVVYLNISFLYSIFTALIYFNFHQSILYMQRTDKRATRDYLISLGVAVTFGLSMLAPRYAIGLFFGLAAVVFRKKTNTSVEFSKSLENHVFELRNNSDPNVFSIPFPTKKEGGDLGDDPDNEIRVKIATNIRSALEHTGQTPATWADDQGKISDNWRSYGYVCAVFIVLCYIVFSDAFGYWQVTQIQLIIGHTFYLVVLLLLTRRLVKYLTRTEKNLSAGSDSSYQNSVDRQFIKFVQNLFQLFDQNEKADKIAAFLEDEENKEGQAPPS